MKIQPVALAWGAAVGLCGVVLVAAYYATGPARPDEILSRIQTDEGWTETSSYIETPSGQTRVYKLYDETGVLCFIAESRNSDVAIDCAPASRKEAKPDPGWSGQAL